MLTKCFQFGLANRQTDKLVKILVSDDVGLKPLAERMKDQQSFLAETKFKKHLFRPFRGREIAKFCHKNVPFPDFVKTGSFCWLSLC